ncbi:MAG TPA: T9SS type A sorting domain-containing protein [Saprospiraceae bacterium]|nr:T9SS type A sorting domain-containing protein [Saprospiraceae bacterium]
MKHNILLTCLLFQALFTSAQLVTPNIEWINGITSMAPVTPDELDLAITDIAVSPGGQVYIAGSCFAPCTFAPGVVISPNAQTTTIFLAKYQSNGQLAWIKTLEDDISATVYLTAPEEDGVYLTTAFTASELQLGNGITVSGSCSGINCTNVLLAKFDNTGQPKWARVFNGGNFGFLDVTGIAAAPNNRVAVSMGYNSGQIDLGPNFQYNNLSSLGLVLAYVNTDNGATTDAIFPIVSNNPVYAKAFAMNDAGQSVITGTFNNQIVFSGGMALGTGQPEGSYFVAVLDADGTTQWAKKISSSGTATSLVAVDIDMLGNAYTALWAQNDIRVDNNTILDFKPNLAGVVLKLNAESNSAPVFIINNTDYNVIDDVKVDDFGHIYTAGTISTTIEFGSETIGSDGCFDALVTISNTGGNPLGIRTIGENGCELISNAGYGSCIELDDQGNVYGYGIYIYGFEEEGYSFNARGGFLTKMKSGITDSEEPATAQLDVFPNPNTGEFTLKLPESPSADAFISIRNLQGQELYRQTANQQEINLETTLSPGLYLVSVTDGKRIYSGKIERM